VIFTQPLGHLSLFAHLPLNRLCLKLLSLMSRHRHSFVFRPQIVLIDGQSRVTRSQIPGVKDGALVLSHSRQSGVTACFAFSVVCA